MNRHDVGVYFVNVGRIELSTKDVVQVFGTNGERLQEIEFKTPADAERFIDAVAAMREQRLRMDRSPDGTEAK